MKSSRASARATPTSCAAAAWPRPATCCCIFPKPTWTSPGCRRIPLPGREGLYAFTVGRVRVSRNFKKRSSLLTAQGEIGGRPVTLVFFNQPYLLEALRRKELALRLRPHRRARGQVADGQPAAGAGRPARRHSAPLPAPGNAESRHAAQGHRRRARLLAGRQAKRCPKWSCAGTAFPAGRPALRAIHQPQTLDRGTASKK